LTALDASALLAFLFREPGHERVAPHLSRACMSTVNLGEVLTRFARDGHDPALVLARLRESPLELVPFLAEHAALAAALEPRVRHLGLSLGGRACLALALARRVPALTADRAWLALDLGVEIRCIR